MRDQTQREPEVLVASWQCHVRAAPFCGRRIFRLRAGDCGCHPPAYVMELRPFTTHWLILDHICRDRSQTPYLEFRLLGGQILFKNQTVSVCWSGKMENSTNDKIFRNDGPAFPTPAQDAVTDQCRLFSMPETENPSESAHLCPGSAWCN